MSTRVLTAVFEHSHSKGAARLVLLAMADEAADTGELTAYRRSQRRLARKAGVDRRTVQKITPHLVELGELEILATGDGRVSSDYWIRLPGLADEGRPETAPGAATRLPRGGEVPPPSSRSSPVLPGVESDTRAHDLAFQAFWDSYPRRVAKPDARRAWDRAIRRARDVDIIRGAERYRDECRVHNREPKYIAHPATWLNRGRWDDDPLPPPRSNGHERVATEMSYPGGG
jgi:hypothetical protein